MKKKKNTQNNKYFFYLRSYLQIPSTPNTFYTKQLLHQTKTTNQIFGTRQGRGNNSSDILIGHFLIKIFYLFINPKIKYADNISLPNIRMEI